jgi:type II secretory pathway pseudopilin PulG
MQLIHKTEHGDTIIEVLFAFAVFAMVVVGSLTIMNQGTATAQRALEVTLVRQQIDAQAEAIRYIHQSYVAAYQQGVAPSGTAAEWIKMTNKATGKGADSASDFGQTNEGSCPTGVPGQKPFILDARTATVWNATPSMNPVEGASLPPFSQVIYNTDSSINSAYGIWVEAVPSPGTNGPGFVDFHIRACWSAAGSNTAATLGTIVRLYEPR